MDKKIYIANWKSHKTKKEAMQFFDDLQKNLKEVDLSGKEVIIAPPFTLLAKCHYLISEHELPVRLAAQNVSSYPEGAYTGEISAKQVKEFAEYVIVGHSERRKYLHENENDIENKIREAKEAGLTVIQCIQDENTNIYKNVDIVAYEPPSAIGTGNPDDPSHIAEVFEKIKEGGNTLPILYGGSVAPQNISDFLSISGLSGFLIGGASLDANSFIALISK
jgi:triosephosphate isomerase